MIGASIKRARLANCLSLQQLVDRMKDNGVPITKTTLFNYEAGSIIPSDNLLEIFGLYSDPAWSAYAHRRNHRLRPDASLSNPGAYRSTQR